MVERAYDSNSSHVHKLFVYRLFPRDRLRKHLTTQFNHVHSLIIELAYK